MKIQYSKKLTLALMFGLTLLIVLAHNPMSGYIKQKTTETSSEKVLAKCSEEDKNNYTKALTEFYLSDAGKNARDYADAHLGGYEKILKNKIEDCHIGDSGIPTDASIETIHTTKTTELSFNEVHTTNPKIIWLGNITHAIYAVSGTIALGLIFLVFL
ncbi:MAG: hypothetical protein ACAH07_01790 [Methylophilaceae bacterium]|nr:hypothetical protein [Methyloradius sp.]